VLGSRLRDEIVRVLESPAVRDLMGRFPYQIVAGSRGEAAVQLGDRQFSLQQISALVLAEVKGVAQQWLKTEVNRAVITVPAYYNDNQRQAVRAAGALAGFDGWYFHATGLTQGGGNLGLDLGLVTGPSGLVSANTTRLDSWWIEKRWLDDRVAVRVGQFAGQDFYGNAQFGESFIMSPLNYALGNLATTLETFNPFATPAAEIRISPIDNFYVKSMVMAGDPSPATSNPTGLLPQFRGSPVIVSEIGFTPGRKATSAPVDDVESRKGYSGVYQFGAAYNPGSFTAPLSPTPVSGNYLLYWKASQALWRVDPKEARGLDATFALDWSPLNINRNFMQLTAGLRFNEPLPIGFHNTVSLGYVRNSLSPDFLPPGMAAWQTEHGFEFNVLLRYGPLAIQPVFQYYTNVGGNGGDAFVVGFRTKIDF